jgi:hypothetical protein
MHTLCLHYVAFLFLGAQLLQGHNRTFSDATHTSHTNGALQRGFRRHFSLALFPGFGLETSGMAEDHKRVRDVLMEHPQPQLNTW